jgi:hypothetical protein
MSQHSYEAEIILPEVTITLSVRPNTTFTELTSALNARQRQNTNWIPIFLLIDIETTEHQKSSANVNIRLTILEYPTICELMKLSPSNTTFLYDV